MFFVISASVSAGGLSGWSSRDRIGGVRLARRASRARRRRESSVEICSIDVRKEGGSTDVDAEVVVIEALGGAEVDGGVRATMTETKDGSREGDELRGV